MQARTVVVQVEMETAMSISEIRKRFAAPMEACHERKGHEAAQIQINVIQPSKPKARGKRGKHAWAKGAR